MWPIKNRTSLRDAYRHASSKERAEDDGGSAASGPLGVTQTELGESVVAVDTTDEGPELGSEPGPAAAAAAAAASSAAPCTLIHSHAASSMLRK